MHDVDGKHLLRIGDLARITGKTVRAIHLYEELGLSSPTTRSSGGFRLFEHTAVDRLSVDRPAPRPRLLAAGNGRGAARVVGAPVPERGRWSSSANCSERKLEETREAKRRHERLEQELEEGLAYLETCRECATPEAPVNGCAHCTQDHGMKDEPALVAGIVTRPERTRRSGRAGIVRVEDIR